MNEFKTCDVYMYNGVLLSHKEKWNYGFCRMNGTGHHQVKWNKPILQWQVPHFYSHLEKLEGKRSGKWKGFYHGGRRKRENLKGWRGASIRKSNKVIWSKYIICMYWNVIMELLTLYN
jgi:hypothetical protein